MGLKSYEGTDLKSDLKAAVRVFIVFLISYTKQMCRVKRQKNILFHNK